MIQSNDPRSGGPDTGGRESIGTSKSSPSRFRGNRGRWEALCKRCGACCYEKREIGFFRFYTDYSSPCSYLDPRTKECRVYENRFSICGDCRKMTILHALFASYLPDTCGYVEYYRKSRPLSNRR